MTTLCDFDRSLIEQAYALAMARLPSPIATDECALCRELERHCIVHRVDSDWPSVGVRP